MGSHADIAPPSRSLLLMEVRAIPEFAAFFASYPLIAAAPRGDGHSVLVLPGLITSDRATVALRTYLAGQGYDVHGWELGRNYGPLPGFERRMKEKVARLAETSGRKVSLVGWSLGGIYARQLAKMMPEHVRRVITLGSPFKGSPKATNAWRVYEFTSGHKVDDRDRHMGGFIADPPPGPTTAIYSRTDGICAWQACMEAEGPLAENIEVSGSHCGLGHNPAAVFAVADRLALPEGVLPRFDRSGWRSVIYPDPARPH